jgi:hypothetical protein
MRRSGLIVLALCLAAPYSAAAQEGEEQEPPRGLFISSWICPQSVVGDIAQAYDSITRPIEEELVAEGKMVGAPSGSGPDIPLRGNRGSRSPDTRAASRCVEPVRIVLGAQGRHLLLGSANRASSATRWPAELAIRGRPARAGRRFQGTDPGTTSAFQPRFTLFSGPPSDGFQMLAAPGPG